MARPGRSEDTSVPIWLKLSAVDSAKMDQVLARPEFEGWTRGEWCLEIIQTALRYYTRPRPAGEPRRKRAPASSAADPAPPPAETAPLPAAPEPPPARPAPAPGKPVRTAAERPRPAARRASPSREEKPGAPERARSRRPPEPEQRPQRASPSRRAPQSRRPERPRPAEPGPRQPPEPPRPEPEPSQRAQPDLAQLGSGQPDLAELDQLPELECSHPAEARDYQSGTCAACGAILWDLPRTAEVTVEGWCPVQDMVRWGFGQEAQFGQTVTVAFGGELPSRVPELVVSTDNALTGAGA